MISVSRNASEGENTLKVKCLKNRHAGLTGVMGYLKYNSDTATLEEVNEPEAEDTDIF